MLPSAPAKVERTEGEVLQEILQLVRNQDRRLEGLEKEKTREAILLEALRQRQKTGASLLDIKLPLHLALSRSVALGQTAPLDIGP